MKRKTTPQATRGQKPGSRAPKAATVGKPTTIDEYLAAVRPEQRAALEELRQAIRAAAPRAEECISYQMPAFRLDGRMLAWFGAGANHCAFYPGGVVADLGEDLAGYDTSKGTIRFQADHPLPAALVRKLVKARIARNAERRDRKEGGKSHGDSRRAAGKSKSAR